MTPEQLTAVAERLGWMTLRKEFDHEAGMRWMVARDTEAGVADGERLTCGRAIGSDGDLLLAILNRAAERCYLRNSRRVSKIIHVSFDHGHECYSGSSKDGDELEAAILAFIQIPPSGRGDV